MILYQVTYDLSKTDSHFARQELRGLVCAGAEGMPDMGGAGGMPDMGDADAGGAGPKIEEVD